MAVTRKVLVLGFTNGAGKSLSLTVNEPIENADGEVVASVMQEIVASAAFGEESTATNIVDAKYVIQQEEAIALS